MTPGVTPTGRPVGAYSPQSDPLLCNNYGVCPQSDPLLCNNYGVLFVGVGVSLQLTRIVPCPTYYKTKHQTAGGAPSSPL